MTRKTMGDCRFMPGIEIKLKLCILPVNRNETPDIKVIDSVMLTEPVLQALICQCDPYFIQRIYLHEQEPFIRPRRRYL